MTFYTFLPKLINMSLTASVAIVAVAIARLLLKRVPKVISYALWGVVLIRLLCPVSIESSLSILPKDVGGEKQTEAWLNSYAGDARIVHDNTPAFEAAKNSGAPVFDAEEGGRYAVTARDSVSPPQTVKDTVLPIAAAIWCIGIAAMAAYAIVSYLQLRRKLITAVRLRENIYLADEIASSFVMGLFRPKIYLPSDTDVNERSYILLHEQHHIRRGDHWWKGLAFLALCLHWFNPLVWVAFVLAGRDMEMSCDEAVVKKMGEGVLADYSASLLRLATGKRIIAGMPLAFGEGDPKGRIRNLKNWKKPTFWVVLAAAIVCIVAAVCLLTNPKTEAVPANDYANMEDYAVEKINIIKERGVTYSVYEENAATHTEVKDTVDDVRVLSLDCCGELAGLAEGGTLEVWEMALEVRPTNEAKHEIVCAGGAYTTEDGYWYGGQSELLVVLRRDSDQRYEILHQSTSPEHSYFFEYRQSGAEALYDWYVTEKHLGLPLYVEDWIERIDLPEEGSLGNFPVHRYDGDGWYVYIPVQAWKMLRGNNDQYTWASEYSTGSKLEIIQFTAPAAEVEKTAQKLGFTETIPDSGLWEGRKDGIHTCYYHHELPDGGSVRVEIRWLDENITDYPYIAIEPQVLRLMAESFGVVSREEPAAHAQSDRILAYTDLNHNGVSEDLIVSAVAPDTSYELRVEENGEVLWSTEAGTSHAGWNTIMLYNEGGKDYLVQYNPTIYQGVGSYTCSVFSLEGGEQIVKQTLGADFELPVKETPEMQHFAREVGVLLRSCYVLLSTEQGIAVDEYVSAVSLPQLSPVRFDPDEVQKAISSSANASTLTVNAFAFPDTPLELVFASGAGGWGTTLTLNPDGSFSGSYSDADMGDGNANYPNGTYYVSNFEGRFSDIRQISDSAWSMKLESLTTEKEPDQTWVEDGTRYISAEAHGVAGGEEFVLYAPGASADLLSADCRSWWPAEYRWRMGEIENLEGWALCNLSTGHAFYTDWLS